MDVHVLATTELGDRSYLVAEGRTAVVVDPQRDIDRVESLLDELGLACELVVETHIHNDYVTGGYQLARRTGARYAVNAEDPVQFERTPVRDGDQLVAGPLTVDVVATPGHTFTHLAYVVSSGDPTQQPVVFTGGSLLYGSVGRTDLLGTQHTEVLTRHQYHSAHRLADALDDTVAVYPTHGFGSFCSTGATTGDDGSTIGDERRHNDAFVAADEDRFVTTLIANLTAYPAYYAHMAGHNVAGPAPLDLGEPAPADPVQVQERLDAGEWVIDLRDRSAYAAGHLVGTISIELGDQFSTYVGWLLPWGAPLTLLADAPEDIHRAQRQLGRIGIDRLEGATTGPYADLAARREVADYPTVTFADAAFRPGSDLLDPTQTARTLLDVRREDERSQESIPGSLHVPLHQLLDRMADIPTGTTLWVHCASGFRAGIASSILSRAGYDVVHIDDEYENYGRWHGSPADASISPEPVSVG
ncbi:MAG TPA: MBL fold metallo-hydrolase [Microlunatus sp.]|nr:MBL fold metallo-hydrolase [Microlunatus sp.]